MRLTSITSLIGFGFVEVCLGSEGGFFRTCNELGISGHTTLVAHCLRNDGSRIRSELDLNGCYGASGLDSYNPQVFPSKE
jgi:hypothetical protein